MNELRTGRRLAPVGDLAGRLASSFSSPIGGGEATDRVSP